ncbi:MAG: hypothetical protein JO362_04070 [Streptomycetaceae bacterium]|nr:hypothetical protein [Streptomycetaceae bacterium]
MPRNPWGGTSSLPRSGAPETAAHAALPAQQDHAADRDSTTTVTSLADPAGDDE